ncbi:MAG: DNA repair protein RecN [Myxococcota bacterium]|nr:DNA repair protein RecN [Myxococcota bacterium]
MIETLRIENFAVVEQLEIELGAGLCVLTGETGAGKSIVLGALALLAGGRASSEVVREGAEQAVVEAVLRTDGLPGLEAALAERGFAADDHELVVSRTVSRSGRSRAQLAGRLVPIGLLGELLGPCIEISSQHESQSLRRPESHARLLDAFGGLAAERARVERGYGALRDACAERARLEAEAAERERRRDFLAFQRDEIDAVALEPGELAALPGEHARLVHAEQLRGEAGAAAVALCGDAAGGAEGANAADAAGAALSRVEALAELDPELGPLVERLRGVHAELAEAARDLERYADGVDVDPGRLAAVEERLGELERVRAKYGRSEDEILAHRDQVARELDALEGSDARLRELGEREDALRGELERAAGALSRGRARTAEQLAREVEAALAGLDMPKARLRVALEPARAPDGLPCGPGGAEQVELQLAANPGESARPLHRVASGGELSRVFLALKNALRRAAPGGVLVFDEVDAGIGGRAADRVGRLLGELASHHQVLCITHLPQIAAAGSAHLQVAKRTRRGRTMTAVTPLDEEARVDELARMAGGERISEATRRHARELLRACRRGAGAPVSGPNA